MESAQRKYSHCHTQGINIFFKPKDWSVEPEMVVVGRTLQGRDTQFLEVTHAQVRA